MTNRRPMINPLLSGGGLAISSPENFRRAGAVLVHNYSETGSDEDESSDMEVDDSPGRRLPKGNSNSGEHSESSSSRETVRWRQDQGKKLQMNEYTEEDEEEDTIAIVEKDQHSKVPSASPFHGSDQEMDQAPDQISASRSCGIETSPLPLRRPDFHESWHGPWHSVIAYDACTRVCLHAWARDCMEAPIFLENECALLRDSFGLQHILLRSEEELLAKRSAEIVNEGTAPKRQKTIGKMKVQVRKVRMSMDMPLGWSFPLLKTPILKLESLRGLMLNLQSTFSSKREAPKKVCVLPRLPANSSSTKHSLAYIHATVRRIPQLLKIGFITGCNSSSHEAVQETYSCYLRLKSLREEDGVPMQPGSGETRVFFHDRLGDNLFVEVYDSKGKLCGRALVQLESIAEDPGKKLRWWPCYREPEHTQVGRIQLYVDYATTTDEKSCLKCGFVAETIAYDIVLETALKAQDFHQRNLLLHGSWKWLLTEFASYYGVSDAYTKLRYLSYVMDVATPTADCLVLVYDLLLPVILKSQSKNPLTQQENRILGEIEEKIEQILALVFENYKSLDESSPSGIVEVLRPANGSPAPALMPAVKLYILLHDMLSPEAQLKLHDYFQIATKKRSRRHLLVTDEFVANKTEGTFKDSTTLSNAYQKMKTLCFNIRDEICKDIEIYNHHVLPSFIDLPNISASIYSVELFGRLCVFLAACPPAGPCPPVVDLVIAVADFEKDLAGWNICPVKGGVDAKELFHTYILSWIQDSRLELLQSCKLDKVKWPLRNQQLTTPFVDEIYDRLKDILNEYKIVICRWPEYTFVLEIAIADIEKAVIESLEKQYTSISPVTFGLKYVQKLAKLHSFCSYTVPDELGTLLNTMRRLLDVLWPRIEMQLKSWSSCMPASENIVAGERLSEVTVILKAKFKNYVQVVVEKLSENNRAQNATKIKKIIQDSKDDAMESDIHRRVQPLKDQLIDTINHLHKVLENSVFLLVCRAYWDQMGQDVLCFLENQKENRSSYRGARVTVSVLDEIFASQMQQMLGNAVQEKDLEAPISIMEVRSVLFKDSPVLEDASFNYCASSSTPYASTSVSIELDKHD